MTRDNLQNRIDQAGMNQYMTVVEKDGQLAIDIVPCNLYGETYGFTKKLSDSPHQAHSRDELFVRTRWSRPVLTKEGREAKYTSPRGSGSKPFFNGLYEFWDRLVTNGMAMSNEYNLIEEVFITEGEFKAAVACKNDIATVGTTGVNLGSGAMNEIRNQLSLLPNLKKVTLIHDSDAFDNSEKETRHSQFFKGVKEFFFSLRTKYKLSYAVLNKTSDSKDGLDDVILKMSRREVQSLRDDLSNSTNKYAFQVKELNDIEMKALEIMYNKSSEEVIEAQSAYKSAFRVAMDIITPLVAQMNLTKKNIKTVHTEKYIPTDLDICESKTLIVARAGTGKTHSTRDILFAQGYSVVVEVYPYEIIARQQCDDLVSKGVDAYAITGKSTDIIPDFMSEGTVICTTYDSLSKYTHVTGEFNVSNSVAFVVDEVHNLIIQGSFRAEAISNVIEVIRSDSKVVMLSASNIPLLSNFTKNEIHVKNKISQKVESTCYVAESQKECYKTLCDIIRIHKDDNTKHVVRLNSISKLIQLASELALYGIRAAVCHSKSGTTPYEILGEEVLEDIKATQMIPEDVDVLLSTAIITDGLNILNENVKMHCLFESEPALTYQFIKRARTPELLNGFIYLTERDEKPVMINDAESYMFHELKEVVRATLDSAEDLFSLGGSVATQMIINRAEGRFNEARAMYDSRQKYINSIDIDTYCNTIRLWDEFLKINVIYIKNEELELTSEEMSYADCVVMFRENQLDMLRANMIHFMKSPKDLKRLKLYYPNLDSIEFNQELEGKTSHKVCKDFLSFIDITSRKDINEFTEHLMVLGNFTKVRQNILINSGKKLIASDKGIVEAVKKFENTDVNLTSLVAEINNNFRYKQQHTNVNKVLSIIKSMYRNLDRENNGRVRTVKYYNDYVIRGK